ncbi:MAG: hypothetical protein ACR2N3_09725 [Pyrinomonadaceae bacterium]
MLIIITVNEDRNREGNSLLPICLFCAVYFNHEKGFVIFNPREK